MRIFLLRKKKHPNSAAQPNIAHIKPYFIPIPQRKDRQYLPDLDSRREQMEEKYDEWDYIWTIKDIKYIFTHHKDLLSFHDVVEIYLWIIDMKLNNLIQDDTINFYEMFLLLQHIYPYEQNLDSDQKHYFWTYAWNACFFRAQVDDEIKYYDAANKAFDKALEFSHMSENPSSDKFITYLKSVSLFKLKAYDESLRAINDFLDICWRDTKKIRITIRMTKKYFLIFLSFNERYTRRSIRFIRLSEATKTIFCSSQKTRMLRKQLEHYLNSFLNNLHTHITIFPFQELLCWLQWSFLLSRMDCKDSINYDIKLKEGSKFQGAGCLV